MTATLPRLHRHCPSWCVNRHGLLDGEEDWVHTGLVTPVGGGVMVKLIMSVNPETGATDGPHVLVGDDEITVAEARLLGQALMQTVDTADG